MALRPQVVSPLHSLGTRDGIELVLVSVEAWPDEVMVRLRGFPDARTADLEREHEEALAAWHEAGAKGEPPGQPAESLFRDVRLTDNLGTTYSLRGSSRGGSGTMFRADYVFVPGQPPAAETLVVAVEGFDPVDVRLAS